MLAGGVGVGKSGVYGMTCEITVEHGSPVGVGDRPNVRETGSVDDAGGSVDVAGGSVTAGEKQRSSRVTAVIVSLFRLSFDFEAIDTADCTWDRSTSFSRWR
ncbi:unnamed protein product [Cuscuta epithymum]|uniref:Uncharacterized protein n=1 Tax=Cuscuta epithymum TaxID=186058 RepID=A0AAV0EYR4_9ASTE|nr:unnamed protein product [Cuscuta epithymum]